MNKGLIIGIAGACLGSALAGAVAGHFIPAGKTAKTGLDIHRIGTHSTDLCSISTLKALKE